MFRLFLLGQGGACAPRTGGRHSQARLRYHVCAGAGTSRRITEEREFRDAEAALAQQMADLAERSRALAQVIADDDAGNRSPADSGSARCLDQVGAGQQRQH